MLLDWNAVAMDGRAGRSIWIEHAPAETCGRCGLPRNVAVSGLSGAARYCCLGASDAPRATVACNLCRLMAVVPPALSAGSRRDPDPSGSSR